MSYQLKSFANFLILFAAISLALIFGPIIEVETRYQFKKMTPTSFEISAIPGEEFSLLIPKISAKAKVFKNVNAAQYKDYIKALRQGVAHAAGTGLPGDKDSRNIFLFAHSSIFPWDAGRVNPVFYLLNKLEKKDVVYLFFQGKKFTYEVFDKKIISPKEVEEINNPGKNNYLILQTCYPPGTNFRRLLVYCRKKE